MIIDGNAIAHDIKEKLKAVSLTDGAKPHGFFGAALVGDDPASVNFLKQKERVAQELGIEFRLYQLPATMKTDELRAEIGRLAAPKACGAFIVQLPLPAVTNMNRYYVMNAIPKQKDVDCLTEPALGAFYTERGTIAPPSVATVEEILRREERLGDLRSLKAVMVGAGFLIGKPVGFWLQNRVAELVVLDAGVKDIHTQLADADVVIAGAGHANLFGAAHLKEGATVIDFGFNRNAETGKIVGDFDTRGAEDRNIHYTKTPGGTGPVLVAKLFENFYTLGSDRRL